MYIIIVCFLFLIRKTKEMEIDLRLVRDSQSYTLDDSNFYMDNEYLYLIPLCIGTPPQCFNVFYEVNFTHLLLSTIERYNVNRFVDSDSTTSKNSTIMLKFDKIKGFGWTDKIILESFESSFDWLYGIEIYGIENTEDGELGFGGNIPILVRNIMKNIA